MTVGADVLRRNLCAIYSIPPDATDDEPEVAVRALLAIYGVPLQPNLDARVKYGNEILAAVGKKYDPYSVFVGLLGQNLVMMEQYPYYYRDDSLSTEKLVEKFVSLRNHNWWLEKLGMVGGPSAVTAGAAEVIKKGSVRAGAVKLATRLGTGAVGEAIGGRVVGSAGGAVAIFVLAGAQVVYWSGEQQMGHIRALLQFRFKSGQMTNEQYRTVFGGDIDPTEVKKYWEMR